MPATSPWTSAGCWVEEKTRILVVLAGHRERGLALQVEVLLTADPQTPFEAVGSCSDGGRRVAAFKAVRRQQVGSLSEPVVHGDPRRAGLDFDAGAPRGPAGDIAGLGHDREDDFAGEADRVSGQDRVIPGCGAAVVPAGNVPRFENGHNSREGAHGGEIHGADEAASGPRRAGRQVHRARRLRQIVDVVRRAADVPRRTVVGESPPDAPARCAAGSRRS